MTDDDCLAAAGIEKLFFQSSQQLRTGAILCHLVPPVSCDRLPDQRGPPTLLGLSRGMWRCSRGASHTSRSPEHMDHCQRGV